jgi:hypothetical protein
MPQYITNSFSAPIQKGHTNSNNAAMKNPNLASTRERLLIQEGNIKNEALHNGE